MTGRLIRDAGPLVQFNARKSLGPVEPSRYVRISSLPDRITFSRRPNIENAMSYALAITLRRLPKGWAVCLTNGRELARFEGLGARFRALRYLRALEA